MSWLKFKRDAGILEVHKGKAPNQSKITDGYVYKTYQSVRDPFNKMMCAPSQTSLVASYPAHNRTASNSNGQWPSGVYDYAYYNAHPEAGNAPVCYNTAYGCDGIHVFQVNGRSGMGVHAGRTDGSWDKLGGVTMGCIRVPANAMTIINSLHNGDKLEAIIVE